MRDSLIPAPFLVGLFIKLAIPFINQILTKEFSFSIIAGMADRWYADMPDSHVCGDDIVIPDPGRKR